MRLHSRSRPGVGNRYIVLINHGAVKLSRKVPKRSGIKRLEDLELILRPLRWATAILLGLAFAFAATAAEASMADDFMATLPPAQKQEFGAWRAAQVKYERQLDAYWETVAAKKKSRARKRTARKPYTRDDYVQSFPPVYKGPQLNHAVARGWSQYQAARAQKKPETTPSRIQGLNDFLAAAKKHYGFEPTRISEREFKRRYAEESLALGLEKDHVVRVYALETGGKGTADMQAGINPTTGKGRPISTALGYAQLLAANTIEQLVKHGDTFIARLKRKLAVATNPKRAAELKNKIASVQKMLKVARSIPNDWYKQRALARTSRGYGIHVLNLDGDIGPWLQSVKLKSLKDFAARKGVHNLSGEEIEMMNLTGPQTGLDAMHPFGLTAPMSNFFTRAAYQRNKMTIGKTSAELLAEFTRRMDASSKNPGAVEFTLAFEEVHQAKLPWR